MRQVLRKYLPERIKQRVRRVRSKILRSRLPAIPVLDTGYYLAANSDIAAGGMDPDVHFWRHGWREGRRPNAFFCEDYVFSQLKLESHAAKHPVTTYTGSELGTRPRLIFVSHDASRTGAPAIILRLLEMFSRPGQFECYSILDETGERLSEFRALSHTYVMSSRRGRPWADDYADRELAPHFAPDGLFGRKAPVCALVNSAESYHIGRALARLGVPVISLVHELAVYYPPEIFSDIFEYSEMTVFPSRFVSRVAEHHCRFDMSATSVRGQGLLEDGFGALNRDRCRSLLRTKLGVTEDTLVVLGVGTVDIRKGADLFADTARLYLEGPGGDRPVVFVWFGASENSLPFIKEIAGPNGLDDRIRFLPATADIELMFVGGDIFLLTARADPFPCVVHEAMACGLPVVAFLNGGGAPELIDDSCGSVVAMSDLVAMAGAVRRYADDPALREAHGKAAQARIAADWDYRSYRDDIYAIIRDKMPKPPQGGWPVLADSVGEAHVIAMRGTMADLGLLDRLADVLMPDQALVALIDGRFGRESDAVVAAIRARGWRYMVCQPVHDTDEARLAQLTGLFRNPKPERVSFVNTLSLMSHGHLAPLSFPVQAAIDDDAVPETELIRMLGYLDRIYLSDPAVLARLRSVDLQRADMVSVVPQPDLTNERGVK